MIKWFLSLFTNTEKLLAENLNLTLRLQEEVKSLKKELKRTDKLSCDLIDTVYTFAKQVEKLAKDYDKEE